MVRWLVLFFVALLPLRGWVGDVMAGQMLGQQVAVAQHVADHASHAHHGAAGSDVGHDCAHDDAPQMDESPAAQSHQDCPTCASCQVCSAVALMFDAPAPALGQPSAMTPGWAGHGFASAERDPTFKPPIS